jgi:D-tyrosyl-tRNA(Tyr) deacylase
MKIVLQRVSGASVSVDKKVVGSIGRGYLILLGIGVDDTKEQIEKQVEKIKKLRIFADANDKINLSIDDVNGEVLVISQFTLYADCKKGNRPSFTNAAGAALAEELYEYFLTVCKEKFGKVEKGIFGADMKVSLVNDGPFTLILED